jgi:hypothetical protein
VHKSVPAAILALAKSPLPNFDLRIAKSEACPIRKMRFVFRVQNTFHQKARQEVML